MKLYLTLVASLLICASGMAQESTSDRIQKAIDQLDDANSRVRSDAAEVLAETEKLDDVSSVRTCLKTESDFHVKLALNYAIASQGDKSCIKPLIKSLGNKGHLGYVYLNLSLIHI